ncbi:general L-amino acid transport system permease protein [Aliiroseovarius sediminilitoris]|uniref:General L-amino acid transport system permease protein n=1 Tax=Aliiroseovarius sediminilitoris TaxID=1173584 RepID=A0A1I0N7Y2_9RHOB|nr:amino acid ABC transporter permease [Aliiroseovarius sediminilitoris]SEV97253.1 general L-amino acid transport system permease protein [Aliiroseovarius sediminilitoris]
MSDLSYVRSEMLPERAPPASQIGVVGWARVNLFNGIGNSILTILALVFLWSVLSFLIPWVFAPTWNSASLNECREIFGADGGHSSACWGVIRERWVQLLFGFYPEAERWRPVVAFALLFVALIPVLFNMISRRMNWVLLLAVLGLAALYLAGVLGIILGLALLGAAGYIGFQAFSTTKEDRAAQIASGAKRLPNPLIFSAIFPFIAPWLLWGGSIWLPIGAALGFVVGYFAFRFLAPITGTLAGLIIAVLAALAWWMVFTVGFADLVQSIIPIGLEAVESRNFGGFMLSITIGVVAIACSLPIGIVLALGRQSDLMIVKALCVGFIEFIRGVPLITLLFVASTLLNIFLPPGTNFDIILRVLIMVTLFAAAYMAEVVRGGLAALPKGQYEAADALGLDYWKAQRLIIMPQALKISIPGIVSTFIGVFKDTVLVSIIGLLDPLGLSNAIRADQDWNGVVWELYGFIAFMFFVFCFSMSRYSMYLERRLRTDHR